VRKLNAILIIIAVMIGLMGGAALAGDLTFTNMAAVTNTTPANYGALYDHFACEITSRVGTSDIVVTMQGSITTFDSAFANIGSNKTISNATATASNPSSLQFQDSGTAAQRIRLHIVSGTDIGNTITGICKAVK
jgi:hypothetical protein